MHAHTLPHALPMHPLGWDACPDGKLFVTGLQGRWGEHVVPDVPDTLEERGIDASNCAGGNLQEGRRANQAHPCSLNEALVRTNAIAIQAIANAIVQQHSTTSTTLQAENACKAKDRLSDQKLDTHSECMH